MKTKLVLSASLVFYLLVVLLLPNSRINSVSAVVVESPSPSVSASPTSEPSVSPSASASASPSASVEPTASPTESPSPSPTASPTASPTVSPSPTLSPSPSPSSSASASATPIATASPTPSATTESFMISGHISKRGFFHSHHLTGLDGALVEAVNIFTGEKSATESGGAGDYSMKLKKGWYLVDVKDQEVAFFSPVLRFVALTTNRSGVNFWGTVIDLLLFF